MFELVAQRVVGFGASSATQVAGTAVNGDFVLFWGGTVVMLTPSGAERARFCFPPSSPPLAAVSVCVVRSVAYLVGRDASGCVTAGAVAHALPDVPPACSTCGAPTIFPTSAPTAPRSTQRRVRQTPCSYL